MLQRKTTKLGEGLGPTTGWIHRLALRSRDVQQYAGVTYDSLHQQVLSIRVKEKKMELEVDTVVLCHGQVAQNEIVPSLQQLFGSQKVHVIGGCSNPTELDAKRAIKEGHELALKL